MFQSTPLQEGRPEIIINLAEVHGFQSTPLQEGRPDAFIHVSPGIKFQSTPLQEGRQVAVIEAIIKNVSIHAPAGGATRISR